MAQKINIHFIISAFVLLFCLPLFSGARITEFQARREGNTAVIEWATEEETNLDKFILQRSTDNQYWTALTEIKAQGGNSSSKFTYQFLDATIFKSQYSAFYYRLVTVDNDGQTHIYSVIASISGSSGIRHTWGSLKAMFR